MLTIEIKNTMKHPKRPDRGSYIYVVSVNGRRIADGQVNNHLRELGWQGLLEDVVKDSRSQNATRIESMIKTWNIALDENLKG